jgi:undecaprenyl-diphosphatase
MSILSAIFYGILQGATEFLPVSSSGHLSLAQHFFGVSDAGMDYMLFDILLHLGTFFAVLFAYFEDIKLLIWEFFAMIGDILSGRGARLSIPHRKMGVMILLSTIPLFLILPIKDPVEVLFSSTLFIGFALMTTGVMLYFVDRKKNSRPLDLKKAPLRSGLFVGLWQAFAVLPGISRSGATITGGVLYGFGREFAVKYSFLMSIPAILGANVLSLKDLHGVEGDLLLPFFCGMVAAAVSGFLAIRLITYLAKRKNFRFFSVYCLLMGLFAVIATLI